jgi:CMP-N,N'-diacetyllegionaminic acid synthase
MERDDTLIVIPARAGSRGVKNKNTRLLNGKPLLDYTCELALSLGSDVYLTTDIEDYMPPKGIKLIKRPKYLCDSISLAWDTWLHAVSTAETVANRLWKYHVYLEPTSPLRIKSDVLDCIEILDSSAKKTPKMDVLEPVESVFTVSPSPATLTRMFCLDSHSRAWGVRSHFYKNTPRQLLNDNAYYVKNGLCYACTDNYMNTSNMMLEPNSEAVIIDRPVVNIDTENDFIVAEALMKHGGVNEQ